MWYSTNFKWTLKFKKWLPVEALALLNTILWEDARDHTEEWKIPNNLTWIDLELTKDFSGIQWNESEKTYDLPEKIELIIRLMQEKFPEFILNWELLAQWEDFEDIWKLIVTDNKVEVKKLVVEWAIECPDCWHKFIPDNE